MNIFKNTIKKETTDTRSFSYSKNKVNLNFSLRTDVKSELKDFRELLLQAVEDYADGLVVGLLDYRGSYDASVNTFPATGGSGTAGAVLKGDMWIISVAGTLGGEAVQVGDSLIASVDTPEQTASNWNILNSNISYVPENSTNKETSALDTSETKYPCNNVVKSAVDEKEDKKNQINETSSSTPTPTGNYTNNEYFLTALAVGATFATPSGTPANGNKLLIRIKDDGTSRSLSWNAIYRAIGVDLPTATTANKTIYVGAIYNSADSKWDVTAVGEEE